MTEVTGSEDMEETANPDDVSYCEKFKYQNQSDVGCVNNDM